MDQMNHLNLWQKYRVQISYESRGTYNTKSQIKFKSSMLNSTLCDYSDTNKLVSGTTTVVGGGKSASARVIDKNNKEEII